MVSNLMPMEIVLSSMIVAAKSVAAANERKQQTLNYMQGKNLQKNTKGIRLSQYSNHSCGYR
jgi:hypothetical protein